jgi:hypothetical protein
VAEGDHTLELLLDLDGEEVRYTGGYIARFAVRRVAATAQKPHGIAYALTLHAPDGSRIMGFDNAHGVDHLGSRYGKRPRAHDHWHRDANDEGRPYAFTTAAALVADFFDEIERVLTERGLWRDDGRRG